VPSIGVRAFGCTQPGAGAEVLGAHYTIRKYCARLGANSTDLRHLVGDVMVLGGTRTPSLKVRLYVVDLLQIVYYFSRPIYSRTFTAMVFGASSVRPGALPSLPPMPDNNLPLRADAPEMTWIDLSQAAKLRDVVFQCGGLRAEWISKTLHTIEPKILRHLSLELPRPAVIEDTTWDTVQQEWLDLDSLLVQFWFSHSLRLKVIHMPWKGEKELRDCMAKFLPELTKRGIADSVRRLECGDPFAMRYTRVFPFEMWPFMCRFVCRVCLDCRKDINFS